METGPRVVNKTAANPYHQSFALCVGKGNYSGLKRQHDTGFDGPYAKNQRRIRGYEQYIVNDGNEFHCDRCDRSFRTQAQLESHVSEHIICGREGCQFTAHPKIVDNHVRMQHHTGIYSKISKLNNDEEIAKWVAERKRKYPTRKNIAENAELEKEKTKRGERIKPDTGRFSNSLYNKSRRKPDGTNQERQRGNPRNKKARHKRHEERKPMRQLHIVSAAEEEECNGDIPAFRGIGSLEGEDSPAEIGASENELSANNITDDDEIVPALPKTATTTPSVQSEPSVSFNKSLGLLMASYGSDLSDDDGPPMELSSKAPLAPPVEHQPKPPPVTKVQEKTPQNLTRNKEDSRRHRNERNNRQDNRSKGRGRGVTKGNERPVKIYRKPTLLERLLSKEIRHERNVILQCVRYIVNNNFFDKEQKLNEPNALGETTINADTADSNEMKVAGNCDSALNRKDLRIS